MKRLAGLSLIVGLLSLPIPARAQALTPQAADCALSLAVFRILQVTGVILAPPPETLSVWRDWLISRHPALPDPYLVANACSEVSSLPKNLAQMPPVERELWRNIWAASLPHDLALLEPLSPRAQQLRVALQARAAQPNAAPAAQQSAAPSTT